MKNITIIIAVVFLLATGAISPPAADAQVTNVPQPVRTTLSAAVAVNATALTVASATGFLPLDVIIVDHEVMQIPSNYTAATATITNLNRGYNGTLQTAHASGATVIRMLPANLGNADFFGSCTAANQPHLPRFSSNRNVRDVASYNCNNGMWARQTLPDDVQQLGTVYNPVCTMPFFTTIGATFGYVSIGTNKTPVDGTTFYASIWVPHTMLLTGIRGLNGGTVGTDNLIYTLHRSDGVPIATTATAGTVSSGANAFQAIAFTAAYMATGPARYWIGVQANGTTTRLETIPASSFIGVLGSSKTGTFGTALTLGTLPTSLIADTAPIACVY